MLLAEAPGANVRSVESRDSTAMWWWHLEVAEVAIASSDILTKLVLWYDLNWGPSCPFA